MKRVLLALALALPTLLICSDVFANDFVYCRSGSPHGEAFTDPGFTVPAAPDLQYICGLPVDDHVNQRCPVAIKSACQIGIVGGDAATPGRHNVPSGAWFEAIATTGSATPVKCHCGCFAPDTQVWTTNGDYAIGNLLEISKLQDVSPMVRGSLDDMRAFTAGLPLRAHHFTAGPEAKPLVVIQTSNDKALRLTDTHPVLVLRQGEQVFLRADEIVLGDILFDRDGREVTVTALSSAMLPASAKVINFASQDKNPLAHIIVANDIQVGDHLWQQAINDDATRAELRKSGDLFYLKLIVSK